MSNQDICPICDGLLKWDGCICICEACGRVYSLDELEEDPPQATNDHESEVHNARYGQ